MKTFDHLNVIGLREWIALPALDIGLIRAKIDTGAQTSALHASSIQTFERDNQTWVRFVAHVGQRGQRTQPCEALVVDRRKIRSSNGQVQERLTICTTMVLGDQCREVEFTLTCRKAMRYRVLLGCNALLAAQLVINPGLRYVQDKPQTSTALTGQPEGLEP